MRDAPSFRTIAAAAWVLAASTAAALSAGWLSIGTLERLPLCLVKALSALPCPGCGMGHALLDAFRGHWAASIQYHPLGIPFAAIWTFWLLRALWNRRTRREAPGLALRLTGWRGPVLLALVLGVYVIRL